MDSIQAMMYSTIDDSGFFNGTISEEASSSFNKQRLVKTPIPTTVLSEFQRWRWVSNAWVVTDDLRGHTWYNPNNTIEEFSPSSFDEQPPAGWLYWIPGQNKIVPESEIIAKLWGQVRQQRNRLLSGSDWIVTKSIEQGVNVPTDWVVYRQLLRDITLSVTNPADVQWPNPPT